MITPDGYLEFRDGRREKLWPGQLAEATETGIRTISKTGDPGSTREIVTLRESEQGKVVWILVRDIGVGCDIDQSGLTVLFDYAEYSVPRPIFQVVQVGQCAVISMKRIGASGSSPLLCVSLSGQLLWETSPIYATVDSGPDCAPFVFGNTKFGSTDTISLATGEVLSSEQSR